MSGKQSNLVTRTEEFLTKYVVFPDENYKLALSLWAIGTHCFDRFDAFPYLVITAVTKRAGKTRTLEVIENVVAKPMRSAAMTASTMFHNIEAKSPTLLIDEAESMSSEAASAIRTVLNVGYRKGQTVPRTRGNEDVEYNTYCPKAFCLIGDVNDTLRDRSIVVTMRRVSEGKAPRYRHEQAKLEALDLKREIEQTMFEKQREIDLAYSNIEVMDWLTDRDEELWSPLIVLCKILCPERMTELQRAAVDMSAEKTQENRVYKDLRDAEEAMQQKEYSVRLVKDMLAVLDDAPKAKALPSIDFIARLKSLPLAPWRKFKGTEGLNAVLMAQLLDQFGLQPKVFRTSGGRKDSKLFKGYSKEMLATALDKAGDTDGM